MRLVIKLGGRDYVPVRAIPFVTDHMFRARDIPHLFAYPDFYADAEHDFVMTPYTVSLAGRRRVADRGFFEYLDRILDGAGPQEEAEILDQLPDATVVDKLKLWEFFNFLRRCDAERDGQDSVPRQWREEVDLIPKMAPRIARGFNPALFRETPRCNSRAAQLAALDDLVQIIERGARQTQKPFDRASMPGTKAQLIEEITRRHPGLSRASATLADQLHEIGLRWRQGARAIEPYWPADYLGP